MSASFKIQCMLELMLEEFTTGAFQPHLRLNSMEPLGPCLKARPLVEEVSSMPCAGIGEELMTTMRGSRSETQDGAGRACCHISER